MAKFVFVYHGGKPGTSKEEQDKIMAAWGQWFGELGDALVDGGNPFGAPQVVSADGVNDKTNGQPATGYSVVNAKDQAAAAELAKGCPILADSSDTQVEVYEAFPM
jgi:hypothetical protein